MFFGYTGAVYLNLFIAQARQRFDVPIAAYQVSGEYSMIVAAARNGWLDHDRAMIESLTAIRRAGWSSFGEERS